MPLEIREHRPDSASAEYFARVLRDCPQAGRALQQAPDRDDTRVLEGIFNDRPVAMLLAQRQADRWRVQWLVVHPATRGRGVGTETLRQATTMLAPLDVPDDLRELAARAGIAMTENNNQ